MPIGRKLFLSHFLAVFLVSGSIGTYFYLSAYSSLLNSLQARLKSSAALISQDLVARWGGEEFLILLPHTDEAGGAVVAEKIRRRVEQETFRDGSREFHLRLSFGVAVSRPEQGADDCIKAADAAMYQAKKAGRNRVEIAAGPPAQIHPAPPREGSEDTPALPSSESSTLQQFRAV